ncbi:hypothetical protein [Lactobacillus taiwanensis]|uniref:hypothetical protein n=3 Tax=Lactobacillus taiwanensis TaxID=508451 RepID=UPI000B989DBC|nr:hypothetical protein [Lactobacillus taiwanensis]OYR96242.1 hypothetical protein CBF51_06190 [Lactobacillus taiwanensis]OYS01056.1 hypothetical protein CBF61_06700 [Lactobacillus taiwanensis]OYS13443.1 hypothetical protein CBF69_09030 [Lactobacillus taiwanensis]OYS30695.1 hypothetical protein CBF75_07915 [Lactobacillus taiwanensis]OYS33385.1 hypothetical protein CBF78_06145 [Lactobacillus taiwanensis]
MPLKKSQTKLKSAKVVEGSPIQTPDGGLMSLFKSAKLPAVTLNVEQFAFPETFLVTDARRIQAYKKNPETGWDLKDESGNKIPTGSFYIQLTLSDGDAAQQLVNSGLGLDGLTTIMCTVKKDIPLQKFVPNETLLKLVKPVVMLGFGGQQADRILLVAEDCEEV